jgi:hypothetical protein
LSHKFPAFNGPFALTGIPNPNRCRLKNGPTQDPDLPETRQSTGLFRNRREDASRERKALLLMRIK